MRCSVQNCTNDHLKKTNKSNGITFHKLPKDAVLCSDWLRVLSKAGYRLSKRLVVCSDHFLPEDFDYTRPNQRRIKSGVVPTLMATANQAELKVCRVCLALDVKMYDMKDFKLSEMFQNITGISACDKKDSVLHRVCWECTARLTAAAAFKDKALLSDALLKDLVNITHSDITLLKQNHSSLKSPLTIQTVFTSSDIQCEDTIIENKEIEISLDEETDDRERKSKLRIIEEEKEMEFEEHEPWIDVPMKTEIESDPLAENNIARKSDAFSKLTHINEVFTSSEDDEIINTEKQINNNNEIVSEDNKITSVPIVNDGDSIVLVDDKEKKLKLDVIVNSVDESSSDEETLAALKDVSVKAKQRVSSNVRAVNRTFRLNDKLKENIIALKKNGLTIRAIVKETGISRKTVRLWVRRYQATGELKCNRQGRRPIAYTDESNRHRDIVNSHTANCFRTTRSSAIRHGISLSTVRRHLHAAGIHNYKLAKKIAQKTCK